MDSTRTPAPELSALIQLQSGSANTAALTSLKTLHKFSSAQSVTANTDSAQLDNVEQTKARDAANQFEALLIHSMLKGMRKTTMSENTSNQRALYDDMLDQQLAETMVKAGGLGMAEQLMTQLHSNGINDNPSSLPLQDRDRLRSLSKGIAPDAQLNNALHNMTPANAVRLRMASSHWQEPEQNPRLAKQQRFIEPLKPYAEQTARRLGTSVNAVLAIAALETGWGQHMIKDVSGRDTHNYFGIKAQAADPDFTRNKTKEFIDGEEKTVLARFKSYENLARGINGFADFLLENPRYTQALKHSQDPKRFISEIHKAGYATDPDYTTKALSILKQIDSQAPPL